jgi:hypothetical protein
MGWREFLDQIPQEKEEKEEKEEKARADTPHIPHIPHRTQRQPDPRERPEQLVLASLAEQRRESFYSPAVARSELSQSRPAATTVALPAESAIDMADASCSSCLHRSIYGNCKEPVLAGLSNRFVLVSHSDDGRGCPAFNETLYIDSRADSVIAVLAQRIGFNQADIQELRQFASRHPEYATRELSSWLDRL